mmetsp:Transcript_31611/g.54743  ORF Transcript_31611/g.54743 Transcript_31611/m.54743 type:complete len:282 (+) Transcript_31611:33-878(+)
METERGKEKAALRVIRYKSAIPSEEPTFIYSYERGTGWLHWTNIRTGQVFRALIPSVKFKGGSSWCELPGRCLYFTGGFGARQISKEVHRIDLTRDFSVTNRPPLHVSRNAHNSAYHNGYLYVVGGSNGTHAIKSCERYCEVSDTWEELPPLISGVFCNSMCVHEASQMLYVIGGEVTMMSYNLIQELSLEALEWRLLELELPSTVSGIACFVFHSVIYFLQESKLYLLDLEKEKVKQVKVLSADIQSYYGPSFYSRGNLFASSSSGPVQRLHIGFLSVSH